MSQGRFVWHELMTTDTAAARAFYGAVVGWDAEDAGLPGLAYTRFTIAGRPVAGLMELPESARSLGARPGWIGHVAVDDLDAAVAAVQRLGGLVHVPPRDVPGIGRFAIIADPQQAVLALFTWAGTTALSEPPPMGTPGHIGWNELLATDWEAAFGFYSALFGWQKADTVDMGAMGTYQLFGLDRAPFGGMFNKPPAVPEPFWQYYLTVDDIDAGTERVKAGGGQVLNGPMEVPGGAWIIQAMDPQGAMFALLGTRAQK